MEQEKSTRTFLARKIAIEICYSIHQGGGTPLPVMLDNAFKKTAKVPHRNVPHGNVVYDGGGLSQQDKSFCTQLVYGYLRQAGILRLIVERFVKKPHKLPVNCLQSLLLGVYEILFLATPAHAILHGYVEYTKKQFGATLGGVVNGVLRNIERQKIDLTAYANELRKFPKDSVEADTHKWEKIVPLPKFFYTSMAKNTPDIAPDTINTLGNPTIPDDFQKCVWDNLFESPKPSYRLKNSQEQHEITTQDFALFPESDRCIIQTSSKKKDVDFTRQGISSQLVAYRIAHFIHEKNMSDAPLWDACCGRAGKSLALKEWGVHVHTCSEPQKERYEVAVQSLSSLPNPPQIIQGTLQELAPKLIEKWGEFPLILLDVPCSTSGTLGRNPEVKFRLQNLHHICTVQQDILQHAFKALQHGGYLFYITCSVFNEENDGQVDNFINQNPQAICMLQEYIIPSRIDPRAIGHDILYYAIIQKKPL